MRDIKAYAVIDSPRNGKICVEKMYSEYDPAFQGIPVLCIHPITKEELEDSVPDIAEPEFNHGQVVREVTISWEEDD